MPSQLPVSLLTCDTLQCISVATWQSTEVKPSSRKKLTVPRQYTLPCLLWDSEADTL